MRQAQLSVRTAFAAKTVVGRTIGAYGNHRQGGRCVELHQVLGADTFIEQHLLQASAQVVGGQPGQQRRFNTQAAQPHGYVER
ncbi:hypothetical protein D3C84_1186930 [compost metagenome]